MLSHFLICITLIIMKMNIFIWVFKLLIIPSLVNYLITSFAFNCANSILISICRSHLQKIIDIIISVDLLRSVLLDGF